MFKPGVTSYFMLVQLITFLMFIFLGKCRRKAQFYSWHAKYSHFFTQDGMRFRDTLDDYCDQSSLNHQTFS